MSGRKANEIPAELIRARKRFDRWRKAHRPRKHFDDALWSDAVALARQYGLYRTAKALGLDYNSLKRRLAALPVSKNEAEQKSGPGFVELFGSSGLEYSVELEDGLGAKMRICVKGGAASDVSALARECWRSLT